MELAGIYSPEDFEKVRKALHRKRKRKLNSQWVPLKRKTKIKKILPIANTSFNRDDKNENQNNELVTAQQEAVLEPVEDLLKSDDENDRTVGGKNDMSENSNLNYVKLENIMENRGKHVILNREEEGILNREEEGILNREEEGILNREEEGILNSIKPCVVNLERLQESAEG